MPTDEELMAALFVSEDGELRVEPEWVEHRQYGWWPVRVEDRVAAGILHLIRERDEARDLVAFVHDHAPALCGPDDWSVWDRVKKALRAWKE